MESLSFHSNAKINLGLLLRRKREDGFHDIATVFQQIDLHDDIRFQRISEGIRITSTNPGLPLDENNLIYRAVILMKERLGFDEGLKIHVMKRIPIGGGLGGGSSNAAVTLKAVNAMYGDPIKDNELGELALQLGSDVPFFLLGGTALAQGRGEILTSLEWRPDCWIVIAHPGFRVSTAWAYSQAKIPLTKEEKFTKFKSIFIKSFPHALRDNLSNDLESVVFKRHPQLREMKEEFYRRDAFYAGMSGSGSCVFGLYKRRDRAREVSKFLSTEQGLKTYLARPVFRDMV